MREWGNLPYAIPLLMVVIALLVVMVHELQQGEYQDIVLVLPIVMGLIPIGVLIKIFLDPGE